jgi:lipid-binding SYLF domain-containing protein
MLNADNLWVFGRFCWFLHTPRLRWHGLNDEKGLCINEEDADLNCALLGGCRPSLSQNKVDKRLSESTAVLKTIMAKNERPKDVLEKAVFVMVYPTVRKVGVGLGVTYRRGVIVCRTGTEMNGKWGAPAMYGLDTGSFSTDHVLLVMSQRGANKVLSGKLKLGADASAVAGPSGAIAHGFNDPNVDVVAYSQSKGMFAGASLGSASIE